MQSRYDVIVIGGGHAGTEAAWAAAGALGPSGRVALLTMDPSRIGRMSCNPAIGGLGKGQMVREIDALGGLMGRAIDASGIMFKMLNTSKGAAVHGPRAQADKYAYCAEVQRLLATRPTIDVIAARVDDVERAGAQITGVRVPVGAGVVHANAAIIDANRAGDRRAEPIYPVAPDDAERTTEPSVIHAGAVVLTSGTFLRAIMHTGEVTTEGGRVGEGAAAGMSRTLRALGFELGRLKTGTPPRLDRATIAWDDLERQRGDDEPIPFSDRSPDVMPAARFPHLAQTECRLTTTTAAAHDCIRTNLHRAPMYCGQVEAETGPRYCPSIEDKVVRFAERDGHHVFLEPESLFTNEVYCNGISTSLPEDVQREIIRLMPGCADAQVLHWGYAVEYDMVWPHQIDDTTAARDVDGLFLAGQINCTTGYEEAGAQGVIAGLNAARRVRELEPFRFGRDQAYLGVMMDDLVTKTPREPYRMFTSRAEYRLLLRADNADDRLTPLGRELGLVDDAHHAAYVARDAQRERVRHVLDRVVFEGRHLREIARRPQTDVPHFRSILGAAFDDVSDRDLERVLTECRYEGYVRRQQAEIRRQRDAEHRAIPAWFDPHAVPGLRSEAAEVLGRFRPATMGQARRLAGINPADLTIVAVALKRGPRGPRVDDAGAKTPGS